MRASLRVAAILLPCALLGSCGSQASAYKQQPSAADLFAVAFPEEKVIDLNVAAFMKSVADDPAISKDLLLHEQKDPGFRERYLSKVEAVVRLHLQQELPNLRRSCIKIYEESLSPQEIGDLLAFYRTPAGRKLSYIAIVGGAESESDSWHETHEDGKRKVLSSLVPDDMPALEAMMRSSAYPKMKTIGERIQQIAARHFELSNDKVASKLKDFSLTVR